MKNYIIVTGGAGFIGSNLIRKLLIISKKNIISIDNYSTGEQKNHIKNKRIKYLKLDTIHFSKHMSKISKKIDTVFHFGEFSRIFQSFSSFNECFKSNVVGSQAVFDFCLKNKIKLIYSATSASLGNKGNDKNLSPYAFTKAKNLEFLENLKKWFNFKYEIIYFYNVYGPNQIKTGEMATVIGVFENQIENNKKLTIVKPGTQTRRFTHVDDTIDVCIEAWKKNKCQHYSIFHKKKYSIIEVAKMFKTKVKYISKRRGERYSSFLTKMNLNNKINQRFGAIKLKDYIKHKLHEIN